MSENSDSLVTQRYCSEAEVFVSVAVVAGNPIITVRIVPKGGVGTLQILSDSAAMVQGAAMAGLRDTLKQPPWKDFT
jgi:hypothetical protein